MSRIKKRAYIATAIIIIALAGLAFYTQQQSKELVNNFEQLQNQPLLNDYNSKSVPIHDPQPPPQSASSNDKAIEQTSPQVTPTPNPTPTSSTTKIKNFFIDINDFTASMPTISVESGYKVSLYIKNINPQTTDGLNVAIPGQQTTLIKPGYTEGFTFTASSDLFIPVSSYAKPATPLYNITVDVK